VAEVDRLRGLLALGGLDIDASYAGLERAHRAGKLDRLVGIGCALVLVGIAVALVAGVL
jgi:hypothetical protein